MQSTFYIRLGSTPEAEVSWMARGEDAAPAVTSGELREAAIRAQGARVVVLAPSSPMLTCVASLPPTPTARLRQALPYALEEQFAEDVELLHFAMGKRDSEGVLPVVAVERDVMNRWQALFAEAELRPHVVLNEALALPWEEGEWSLLLQEDEALLRTGAYQAYTIPMAQLEAWLSLAWSGQKAHPQRVTVFDSREGVEVPQWQGKPPGIEIEYETDVSPVVLLARADPALGINLLQGEFSRKEQLGRLWRPWRAIAAMFGVWLLLQGVMVISDYFSLSSRDEELYAAIEKVYRDTFPEARNVVNPRVQMERKLVELQGGGSGGAFAVLLSASGPVLSEFDGLELRNMRYKQDELELELELKDVSSLDRLREALQQQKLAVEIRGATTREDKVESRVALREAGA